MPPRGDFEGDAGLPEGDLAADIIGKKRPRSGVFRIVRNDETVRTKVPNYGTSGAISPSSRARRSAPELRGSW